MDWRNLRRLIGNCDGLSLYSRFMTIRKEQRASQSVLNGSRRIVMLSKFGEENMKIDLESGRRAKSELLEDRLNRYMKLMRLNAKPEDARCTAKDFLKTMSFFHVVSVCGYGLKST